MLRFALKSAISYLPPLFAPHRLDSSLREPQYSKLNVDVRSTCPEQKHGKLAAGKTCIVVRTLHKMTKSTVRSYRVSDLNWPSPWPGRQWSSAGPRSQRGAVEMTRETNTIVR